MIDSFPLPVCKFGRAHFCRSFRVDGANYGKCPSKKETYFGFKVHALITLEGYITAFEITPASVDDREGLREHLDELEKWLQMIFFRYVHILHYLRSDQILHQIQQVLWFFP